MRATSNRRLAALEVQQRQSAAETVETVPAAEFNPKFPADIQLKLFRGKGCMLAAPEKFQDAEAWVEWAAGMVKTPE